MADIWDDAKIRQNMLLLASLQPGDKFKIKDNGDLDRQSKGLFQGVFRSDTDSITNTQRYIDPLKKLFAQASKYAVADIFHQQANVVITKQELDNALNGLKNMLQTYTSGNKQISVKEIVNQVERETLLATHAATFYHTYRPNMVVELHQSQYLRNERGICAAFCLDWIRRKIFVQKDSYKNSKHGVVDHTNQKFHPRIQKKVDNRLREIQSIYRDSGSLRQLTLNRIAEKFNTFEGLYAGSKSQAYGDETTLPFDQRVHNMPQVGEGRRIFQDIYDGCFGRGMKSDSKYFILEFRCSKGNEPGHAFGIHIKAFSPEDPRIHFFDPNMAEFEFSGGGGMSQFLDFGEDLWKLHALGGDMYDWWNLQQFTR